MTRTRASTRAERRPGIWEKFTSNTLGRTLTLIQWLFIAALFSILIEWIGMLFWWDTNHSKVILETELSYLSQFNRNLITGLYPEDIARKFMDYADSAVEAIGLGWAARSAESALGFFGVIAIAAVNIVFLLAVRLAITTSAMPGLVLVMALAAIDGLVEREIRKDCGGNESAFVYHTAKRWGWPVFILSCGFYLTAPISVNPTLVFLPLMLFIGMLMYLMTSRFKKFL